MNKFITEILNLRKKFSLRVYLKKRAKVAWMDIKYWFTYCKNADFPIFSTLQSKVKLATVIESDRKAPFSIATTPRCRR